LELYECWDVDIKPLSELKALRKLELCFSSIPDLTLLDLEEADFSVLSMLTELLSLDVSNCNITDISWLAGLTDLTRLSLSGCRFSDPSPLFELSALEWLNAQNNKQLTQESVNMLREKLPNTEILSDYDKQAII